MNKIITLRNKNNRNKDFWDKKNVVPFVDLLNWLHQWDREKGNFIVLSCCILQKSSRLCALPFQMKRISNYMCENIFKWFISIRFGTMNIPSIRLILWLCVYINHMNALKCMNALKYSNQLEFLALNSLSLRNQNEFKQKFRIGRIKWIDAELSTYSICKSEFIFIYIYE